MAMWTKAEILAAIEGRVIKEGPVSEFTGICLDSRLVRPGDIFIPIVGERHDAHAFIAEVAAKGASLIIVEEKRTGSLPEGVTIIAVPDTTLALGRLAAHHRRKMAARILCLTGTNGKTTTKEMLFLIFSAVFATLKTKGNFNNHIGLPLTLLELRPEHAWALVEAGMNHPGEIAYLTGIAKPDIGLVNNVGPGHLEGVGSVEGVALAKKELIDGMESGIAVLNADDHWVSAMAKGFRGRVIFFGLGEKADVRATDLALTEEGQTFTLRFPESSVSVRLKAFGRHMVENAAAAAAAGYAAGIDPKIIAEALGRFEPVAGRLAPKPLANGVYLLDDTYNANPSSMAAALETLVSIKKDGRAVAILGDMFELGADSRKEHEKLGRLLARLGIDLVFVAGENARHVVAGAVGAGMDEKRIMASDREGISAAAGRALRPGDRVLVKGSRGMAMEKVLEYLAQADSAR